MENDKNKELISEVGFSYEEMLALETATFQREERGLFLEPLEPDLIIYTQKNENSNTTTERGFLKKMLQKRKEKKNKKRADVTSDNSQKQALEHKAAPIAEVVIQHHENIDELAADIADITTDIVAEIEKKEPINTRVNAKIAVPKAEKPTSIAAPNVVKTAKEPPIVEKQEAKPDINELKTTLNNVIASEVEKIKIVVENIVKPQDDKPSIITSAEAIVKPLSKQLLNIKDIIQERLQNGLYYEEEVLKNQIYLHHTVSNGNPLSAINWWRQNSVRVATAIVVAGRRHNSRSKYADGEIYQCFWSKHWAHHLGLKRSYLLPDSPSNTYLNKHSLGIEIANWGWLTLENDGRFMALDGKVPVPENEVVEYSDLYKGHRYYHKYTDAQLESVRKLLLYFCDLFDIPTMYQEGMFDILPAALRGEKGIFTHTSVRPDKSDCHPQAELIEMLRSL